jgi:hypothetical protein
LHNGSGGFSLAVGVKMMRRLWIVVAMSGSTVFAQSAPPRAESRLPAGIILPVRLNNSISSKKAKPGQEVTARIMQNVPLPDRGRIRAGARVVGYIVSAEASADSCGARVSLKFDSLVVSGKTVPISVSLRAIASPMEVEDAQLPDWGADRGTSATAYTTVQVGGDVVYRGGGHVMHGGIVVGEPVYDGVLVRVTANSGEPCRGAVNGDKSPQALWIFSSDACGLYGFAGVRIVQAGRTDPGGEITLAANRGELLIRSGTGMLLSSLGLKVKR